MTKCSSISLSDDHRAALEANRACHGDEVLAWKRAQAFILLDKNEDPETICRTLNIDPTVLTEWIRAYSAGNCSPRCAARSYCLIMSAAFPSSAIRMASIGLYPSSAIESR